MKSHEFKYFKTFFFIFCNRQSTNLTIPRNAFFSQFTKIGTNEIKWIHSRFLTCLHSVSCAQCYLCLWIVHYWLTLQFSLMFIYHKETLKIPKGNRELQIKETDNTMERLKGQTMIYKTLHRKSSNTNLTKNQRCSGRVGSSFSTSGPSCVQYSTLLTFSMICFWIFVSEF